MGIQQPHVPTNHRYASPIAEDARFSEEALANDHPGGHPRMKDYPISSLDLERHPLIPTETQLKKTRERTRCNQSRSTPGFAHHLSHKLSSTFGNPTVVHRHHLRARPSLQSVHGVGEAPGCANSPVEQAVTPQDDTAPSSYNTGSSKSPYENSNSTGKTSLESNLSPGSTKSRDRVEKSAGQTRVVEGKVREKSLHPVLEEVPVTITPTVVTVETTASAKIFFETHFDLILSDQLSPRSLRRRDLEFRLLSEPLTLEQIQQERQLWASQESDYLRQSRVLKSKTNGLTGSQGVSVAGFEVVHVLGKGSFGVVRLVREKASGAVNPSLFEPAQTSTSVVRQDTDLSNKSKARTEVYAMKVIRKSDMLRNSQEAHLRAERDFLVASEKSRWVVPLIASFQDNTNLYLVMEYMAGGDFLGYLIREETLKEKKACWYIAEMILCVEEAHRLRWIHRDIKPDNFLISVSGHLKISDFGLAFDGHWAHDQAYFNEHRQSLMDKLGINVQGDTIDRKEGSRIAAGMRLANIMHPGRRVRKAQVDGPSENDAILDWRNRNCKRKLAKSIVGTSQYMAPEIIHGEPYDGRCDWWSIGIILYEVTYALITTEQQILLILCSACMDTLPSCAIIDRIRSAKLW